MSNYETPILSRDRPRKRDDYDDAIVHQPMEPSRWRFFANLCSHS